MSSSGPEQPAILPAVPVLAFLWTWASGAPGLAALCENTILRALLLFTGYAIWKGWPDIVRLAGKPSRRQVAALSGVILLGAIFRFALTPLPYHANNWMELLTSKVADEPDLGFYSNGYSVFMRLFLPFCNDAAQAIFLGNRVAGLLSPVAVYLAARALLDDSEAALWAAFLMALLPIHVRLSASESMQILPTLMLLLAVAGYGGHARLGSRPLLAIGTCSFAYAVLTRPETAVVGLGLLVIYLAPDSRRRLLDPYLSGGAVAALAVGLPFVLQGVHGHMPGQFSIMVALRGVQGELGLVGFPHALWAMVGVVGTGLLVFRRGFWCALIPITALLGLLFIGSFELNPANRIQLLCAQYPWLLFGAGALLAAVTQLAARSPFGARPAIAVLAAAVGSTVWAAPFFRVEWDQHQEWAFLTRELPRVNSLVPPLPIVRFGVEDSPDETTSFPSLPRAVLDPEAHVSSLKALLRGEVSVPAIYYRGLTCYRTTVPTWPKSGRMFPACAEVEKRYRLVPLGTTVVTAQSYFPDSHEQPMEIGFYRLEKNVERVNETGTTQR